ncbi:reverse transcriptase zinc-binding domain-containing protein [Artemisia annua]|uniref:Reverse transcriptase zinc-binding domain-containing protein n=1 Tax=Artemisia annua TaxID=35608 RepID=A0A2U1PEY8_ARTAN|nr:reverse transcriptase zinc-binding domain-containing protein [Artemisia annua]
MTCFLCNQQTESHSHLFFSCSFSKRLWERLKPHSKLEGISNDWACIISSIVLKPATNTIWSVIQRLVLGACVYVVWAERNKRSFDKIFSDDESVFKSVVGIFRLRLMGLNLKYTSDVVNAARLWDFHLNRNVHHRVSVLMYKYAGFWLCSDMVILKEAITIGELCVGGLVAENQEPACCLG